MTSTDPKQTFRERMAGKVMPIVLEHGRAIEDAEGNIIGMTPNVTIMAEFDEDGVCIRTGPVQ